MAWVTQDLIDVWESGDYVGENTPKAVVQVQLGHWVRAWRTNDALPFPPVKALIWGEGGYGYGTPHPEKGNWSAKWVPVTDWIDVPNLITIKRTRDFQQKGVTVCEIAIDAKDDVPKIGALGDAYHAFFPGWLTPTRNYVAPGRPDPGWETNEWAPPGEQGRLTDGVKIRVWQGYGEPETVDGEKPPVDGGSNGAWTFAGQVDDVDPDGNPNLITITARNGKLLTDQRVFRISKSVQLNDPITFYDRRSATEVSMHGANAAATSSQAGYPPDNVLDLAHSTWDSNDAAYKTQWRSAEDIDGENLEWIEIRMPKGTYGQFWMASPPGRIAYAAIYAKPISQWVMGGQDNRLFLDTEPPRMDGVAIPEGWVDLGHIAPGPHGGWPYVKAFKTGTTLKQHGLDRVSFGHVFDLGRHSILRVGLTNPGGPVRAQVGDLHGLRRVVQNEILRQQFILVDDASEVVKVVLRWAGYQEWDVEEALVRLSDGTNYGPGVVAKSAGRLVFNRQNFLMDIVQEVAKQLGFVFFIADPTDANSDGVPTFRRDSSLLKDNNYIAAHLNDDNMLTGLKVKHTDQNRPFSIRMRGKTAAARGGGVPVGGDKVRRITAMYLPPWSRPNDVRIGGVVRHIIFQDDQLVTYAMCLYGCFLVALNAAAAMHTAIAEIPAHPIIELDDQVSVIDEPTGTNSRLWVIKSEDTMTLGQNASWKQTLQGSLLDTDDMAKVLAQILGEAPFYVGNAKLPFLEEVYKKIDWSHVRNPFTGEISGYTSPVVRGVHRKPRRRS